MRVGHWFFSFAVSLSPFLGGTFAAASSVHLKVLSVGQGPSPHFIFSLQSEERKVSCELSGSESAKVPHCKVDSPGSQSGAPAIVGHDFSLVSRRASSVSWQSRGLYFELDLQS